MSEYIVETVGLEKRFFGEDDYAVRGLGLRIEKGCFYTLLGANGAGKTTMLKLLLGIHCPSGGSARLFGRESVRLNSNDFRRIGYVSETQEIHLDKTLEGLIAFLKPQYPTWDDAFCTSLIGKFELPMNRKLKGFSRGMLLKAKQVLALAYNPDILLMDEPFSGLDPVIRQESIESILEWAQDGERTVLISSHDIDDVEPISERVGIIDFGKLVLDEEVDALKRHVQGVQFVTELVGVSESDLPESWARYNRSGRIVGFVDTDFDQERSVALIKERFSDASQIEFSSMGLKEIYVTLARDRKATL